MPLRAMLGRAALALAAIVAVATNLGAPVKATSVVAFLYVFHGTDGANPTGRLVGDHDGSLYGTTINGGAHGLGVVYRLTPNGKTYTETVLYSFAGPPTDGAHPQGGLIVDNGTVYGTTLEGGGAPCGGSTGCGTVFRIRHKPDGYHETVLHAFAGGRSDGAIPGGQLVLDSGGLIYGATGFGGTYDKGTVFRLAEADGRFVTSILHDFGERFDGAGPNGLVRDESGALFGVTDSGGSYRQGTAFVLMPMGPRYRERVLHSFGGPSDGSRPSGQLTIDRHGALYGTTSYGKAGTSQCCGTAFKLIPNGSAYAERVLFNFRRSDEGINPSPLVATQGGVLYGTTLDGGGERTHGDGTVFELMAVHGHYSELVLHDFAGGRDGAFPSGGLLADRSGSLFGVTANGGGGGGGSCDRGCGVVYELSH